MNTKYRSYLYFPWVFDSSLCRIVQYGEISLSFVFGKLEFCLTGLYTERRHIFGKQIPGTGTVCIVYSNVLFLLVPQCQFLPSLKAHYRGASFQALKYCTTLRLNVWVSMFLLSLMYSQFAQADISFKKNFFPASRVPLLYIFIARDGVEPSDLWTFDSTHHQRDSVHCYQISASDWNLRSFTTPLPPPPPPHHPNKFVIL
jgi:hypothetical protein